MNSRKPDYRAKALNKNTNLKGSVGAGWLNEDKTITVVLDNFVTLKQDGDLVITLFPVKPDDLGRVP